MIKAVKTIAVSALLVWAAGAGSPVRLLETGEGHGDEIDARSGEQWLALAPVKGGFAQRKGPLTIRRVGDAILDQGDEKTGKEVRFPGAKPVFLLRGWEAPPGVVRTAYFFSEGSPPLVGKEPVTIKLNGVDYRLRLTYVRDRDDSPLQRSDLVLESGGERQILYSWPEGFLDEHCELVWAGDLDGDGKLDLYFYLSRHYNVIEHTLFRSRGTAKGKMVEQVAMWRTTGC